MATIWILDTGHRGDLHQMQAVATAIPEARVGVITLARRKEDLPRWPAFLGPSLKGVDEQARALLRPPWPDVVFCAGRGAQAAALWIGRQSDGRTKLVNFVRPALPPEKFDLVITAPPFHPPAAPNVLVLRAPLHAFDRRKVREAADAWRDRLAHLPAPRLALLAGGVSPPWRFTPAEAEELGAAVATLARRMGGSVLLSTTPRTPAASAERLLASLAEVPHHAFVWGRDRENPYAAYLGIADGIIVTIDSLSMMAEAASAGPPALIWRLREHRDLPERLRGIPAALLACGGICGPLHRLADWFNRRGLFQPRQDKAGFAGYLVREGFAGWFGQPLDSVPRPGGLMRLVEEEHARAVAAIRRLLRDATS